MTDEWKEKVNQWLRDNGKDRQWLAAQLGVSAATVKRTIDKEGPGVSRASSLVPRICEITGLALPLYPIQNHRDAELFELFQELDEPDKESVRSLMARLLVGRKPSEK
jgi:hypothetical protein